MPDDLRKLIDNAPLCPLGPGVPGESMHLQILQSAQLIPDKAPPMKDACLAGLWLLYDFLEESHCLSQGIDTPTGSYWHAIMHRREPDAQNAAYWFRRVGIHPVFTQLTQASEILISHTPFPMEDFKSLAVDWDPAVFIGLCEETRGSGRPQEILCREIQKAEWRLLFDYSYAHTCG